MAALTMPALVANHQKKTLETRIKKFYSVIQQAVNLKKAEDNALDTSMLTNSKNPDAALEYFNINFEPYMKTTEVVKRTKGIAVGFPDGSGMYLQDTSTGIAFCVDYRVCKNDPLPENGTSDRVGADGKRIFSFLIDGRPQPNDCSNRAQLITWCKNNPFVNNGMWSWCTKLLQCDGWEVKDDYPIKF